MGFIQDPNDSKKQVAAGFSRTKKQKSAMMWPLDPMVAAAETVDAGDGSGAATALSLTKTVSFVSTATDKSHVSLADGTVTGQVKIIVHKTRSNTIDLVITPANFAAGATLTSNLPSRSIQLIWDGANWQVIAGEITGTAEMVIA